MQQGWYGKYSSERVPITNSINYGKVESLTNNAAGIKYDTSCYCYNCCNYGDIIGKLGNGACRDHI